MLQGLELSTKGVQACVYQDKMCCMWQPLRLSILISGCTRSQLEGQALSIAKSSYGPMLAQAKLGRVASVSPHCCDNKASKAAEPKADPLGKSGQPHDRQQPESSTLLQGRSERGRGLPPPSPFSDAPVSAAKASRLPLVLSARDLMREGQQVR